MNTATTTAIEQASCVETEKKPERFKAEQVEELRQRAQATGKVIKPVLTLLAGQMFHHEIPNKCVLTGLRSAVSAGLQRDVDECLQKWGMGEGNYPTPPDSESGLKLLVEFDDIWRGALIDAFVDWSFSHGVDA